MALCFSFCYFKKLTATTHGGIDGGLRGSWSCIERRAQTEAAALIKTWAWSQPSPGKGGVRKVRRGREERTEELKRGEERGYLKENFTVPIGHGLCWTLINGYCSPWSTQRLFTVSHKGGLYSCSGMHCDKIIWIAEVLPQSHKHLRAVDMENKEWAM